MDDAAEAVAVAGVNVDGVSEKVGPDPDCCGEWRPPCPCGLRKVSSCGMPPRGDSDRLLPASDDRLDDGGPKSAGEGGGCSEFEFVVVAVDKVEAGVVGGCAL